MKSRTRGIGTNWPEYALPPSPPCQLRKGKAVMIQSASQTPDSSPLQIMMSRPYHQVSNHPPNPTRHSGPRGIMSDQPNNPTEHDPLCPQRAGGDQRKRDKTQTVPTLIQADTGPPRPGSRTQCAPSCRGNRGERVNPTPVAPGRTLPERVQTPHRRSRRTHPPRTAETHTAERGGAHRPDGTPRPHRETQGCLLRHIPGSPSNQPR